MPPESPRCFSRNTRWQEKHENKNGPFLNPLRVCPRRMVATRFATTLRHHHFNGGAVARGCPAPRRTGASHDHLRTASYHSAMSVTTLAQEEPHITILSCIVMLLTRCSCTWRPRVAAMVKLSARMCMCRFHFASLWGETDRACPRELQTAAIALL